jgi:hypothetical protein
MSNHSGEPKGNKVSAPHDLSTRRFPNPTFHHVFLAVFSPSPPCVIGENQSINDLSIETCFPKRFKESGSHWLAEHVGLGIENAKLARKWISEMKSELAWLQEDDRVAEGRRIAREIGMRQAVAEAHHTEEMPAAGMELLTEWDKQEPWTDFNVSREQGKADWLDLYGLGGLYDRNHLKLPANWYSKLGVLNDRPRAISDLSIQTKLTMLSTRRSTGSITSSRSSANLPGSASVTSDLNRIAPEKSFKGTSWATSRLSEQMAWPGTAAFYEAQMSALGIPTGESSQGTMVTQLGQG